MEESKKSEESRKPASILKKSKHKSSKDMYISSRHEENNILHFVLPDSIGSNTETKIEISPVYKNNHTVIDSGNIFARIPSEKDTSFLLITNHNKKTVLRN